MSQSTLELFTLDSETLEATITGETGEVGDILWSSDNESVATVDENGKVTGISQGQTLINAFISDEVSTNCLVNVSPSVFAVGFEQTDNQTVAKLWKNGIATNLNEGPPFSAATSVFVDGVDVYVCGIIDNGFPTAVVWKNGELLYQLSDGSTYAGASSIFVYEGDVYVTGSEELGQNNISSARVWKNGNVYGTLTNGINVEEGAAGEDIFVNETGVYTVGYEESPQNINGTPKLWEDNIQIDLTDEQYHGRAQSVFAVGSDVYVAGYENNENDVTLAKVWINGEATTLTDGSNDAEAYSVFVSGEDVYVAGTNYGEDESEDRAVLWTNGIAENFSDTGSIAYSLYVYKDDVYVGGAIYESPVYQAVVWKNTAPLELEITEGTIESAVLSVFVK